MLARPTWNPDAMEREGRIMEDQSGFRDPASASLVLL